MTDEIQEFRFRGSPFRMTVMVDYNHDAPWVESDCHGNVSDWTSRPKGAGEVVLASNGQLSRYYDMTETIARAREEGWAASKGDRDTFKRGDLTADAMAIRAAKNDFDYLKGWCNGDWWYVGVKVEELYDGGKVKDEASLWGIESNSTDYQHEVAKDLASEMLHDRFSDHDGAIMRSREWPGWPYVHLFTEPQTGDGTHVNALSVFEVEAANTKEWKARIGYAHERSHAAYPALSEHPANKLREDLDYALRRVGYLKPEMKLFTHEGAGRVSKE